MTLGQTTSAGQSEFQTPDVRAAARPLLRSWLKAVELKVRTKQLKDLDYRLAAILTNYPSANVGKCWPGQKRLAFQAGRSERTIREALGRLEAQGLLTRRRGGQGRTSSYAFTIDGKLIFGAQSENRKRSSAQIRQPIAGQERQEAAAKPLECDSPEENISLYSPSSGGGDVIYLTDLSTRTKLFDQFWEACDPSERGKKGPASAEWDKLDISDIAEIANLLSRSRLDLDGMWACRWLKQRRWEHVDMRRPHPIERLAAERQIKLDDLGWRRWQGVYDDLIECLGVDVFEAWFGRVKVVEVSDGCVSLIAPSKFVANWISRTFYDRLLTCWRARYSSIERIEVTFRQ